MEKQLFFASSSMDFCHNKKPVLAHSLRMAFYLYGLQYDIPVVIAALLHDLLEDISAFSRPPIPPSEHAPLPVQIIPPD